MTSLAPTLALAGLTLAACSAGNTPSELTGSATIVFTDAASDDLEVFEIDVKNIELTKLGGAKVSATARRARIDFTELESLSDLIVGVGLEAGSYTGLSVTFDFSNAAVCIAGQTSPATVVDEDGNVLTGDVPVSVSFAAGAQPRVAVRRNHMFVLDLDLNQALVVDRANNQVTFSPVVSVEVDPSNAKPVAVTGFLTAVDAATSTITVEKRSPNGNPIGSYDVRVLPQTIYQVDGVVALGANGIAALTVLAGSQPRIFAQGALSSIDRMLTAAAIETGAGTPGNGQDWVIGHVIGRDAGAGNDAVLTVLGRSVEDPSGTRVFNTVHTVNVSATNTNVLRRGSGNSQSADDINVGQRIWAFGTLTGNTLDASGMDGVVRMVPTSVWGIANSAPANNHLEINTARIGVRDISLFDFDVGGNVQTDPSNLSVDVTGLSATAIDSGSKIRSIGWFNPVDVAGDDDLDAISVIDHTASSLLMLCQWLPANATALVSSGSSGITLDVSAALIRSVGDRFAALTLANTPQPTIEPLLGLGLYRIVQNGAVEVHLDFDTFAQSLASRNAKLFRVATLGTFDAPSQTFHALVTSVVLN